MACFWNGLLQALSVDDVKKVFSFNRKPNPIEFVELLKSNAIETRDVKWNGNPLSKLELKENMESIKEFDSKHLNGGYPCSSCDPYILLFAQLFKVNIDHTYDGAKIKYTIEGADKTVYFANNRGHFWFVKSQKN